MSQYLASFLQNSEWAITVEEQFSLEKAPHHASLPELSCWTDLHVLPAFVWVRLYSERWLWWVLKGRAEAQEGQAHWGSVALHFLLFTLVVYEGLWEQRCPGLPEWISVFAFPDATAGNPYFLFCVTSEGAARFYIISCFWRHWLREWSLTQARWQDFQTSSQSTTVSDACLVSGWC